jgi:hypothetical protein
MPHSERTGCWPRCQPGHIMRMLRCAVGNHFWSPKARAKALAHHHVQSQLGCEYSAKTIRRTVNLNNSFLTPCHGAPKWKMKGRGPSNLKISQDRLTPNNLSWCYQNWQLNKTLPENGNNAQKREAMFPWPRTQMIDQNLSQSTQSKCRHLSKLSISSFQHSYQRSYSTPLDNVNLNLATS